ncbi:GNAT family N-acetyltransferase [Amycolatopsis sp.]|jgi:RimJ/RimL family protein N-acetyltransferase|uniref:GNAT family N-acetyltransferase n=1 Tax=Amycolatopsis sp. TaxID=37632 RepID=UPI002DFDFD78|nr:GNAT family N-acetyltransferase [Amycolatopsis sp.]
MPALMPPAIPPGGLCRHTQPGFTVDELLVRPWEPSDAPSVHEAYRDPDIQRWHVRTMAGDEALSWVRSWSDRWAAETDASWAVTRDGLLVGRVGFRALSLAEGSGEAAYWVVPAARGRKIAARALWGVTAWMFGQAGFHRMTLGHSARNETSCRVAVKAGYAYEGTQRLQGLHADGWHDMHLHARINDAKVIRRSASVTDHV